MLVLDPSKRSIHLLVLSVTLTLTFSTALIGQRITQSDQVWSAEIIRPRGQPVIPLFDGWFPNPDGTRSLCFGYFNLNTEQSLDIPVGENNSLDDDRFPAMLPTHFDPVPNRYRHKFCVFTVRVPADFGPDEKIIWSLTAAGETISVPGHVMPAYTLDEPASDGRGNIAPIVKLSANGEGIRGRNGIHAEDIVRARRGQPVTFSAWIEHPDDSVWVGWSHHSGPGQMSFDDAEAEIETAVGPATVSATFSEPGDYVVRMQTINTTAAFEFYCCHTNAYFNVTVSE